MQLRCGGGTGTGNVASIGRDLRMNKHNLGHGGIAIAKLSQGGELSESRPQKKGSIGTLYD